MTNKPNNPFQEYSNCCGSLMDNDQTICPECLEPCEKETRDERGMTWQTEFDEMYQHITNEKNRLIYKGYQYVAVHAHACIKTFIQDLLDKKAREIEKMADVKWLSPPWSPEWSAENYKVEGYRVGVKEIKTEALRILKEE